MSEERTDIITVTNEVPEPEPKPIEEPEEQQEEVQKPAEEPEVAEQEEAEPEVEEPVAEDKPKPRKNGFQERISEVTQQRNAAQEEARKEREARMAAEQRLAELTRQPTAEEAQESAKPTLDQFNGDWTAYTDALTDWKVDQKFKAEQIKQAERAVQEAQKKAEESWSNKLKAAKAELPDFEEVLGKADMQIANTVREAILESDVGPQLAYHLAANPEIAESFKTMSIASQIRELGKLEAKFEKPATKAKLTAEVSKAPAPINPIRASASMTDNYIDADGNFTGTADQYRELRRAGKIK